MNEYLIAVDAPLPYALTYLIPDHMPVERGKSVIVPLGARKSKGVILGPAKGRATFDLKPIEALDETRPHLPEFHLRWLEWLSEYYVYPPGQVTDLAFPPLSTKESKRSKKKKIVLNEHADQPPRLTDEQNNVLSQIKIENNFQVHLVHGVTGSGKTEIYLHLLEQVIARGEQGLILVPEIALTPQLIQRFARRFGQKVAVIHSHLTPRERTDQWWSVFSGQKQILIGARSALFCPLPKLSLIVVDEEHEPSYKQDEYLKYNGRDAAVMLAKFKNIPVILGSATPSIESYQNAQSGKYVYHELKCRVGDRAMPQIEIISLRGDKEEKRNPFWLSKELHLAIEETLNKKEQVALFLNRRGVAQTVVCSDCGFVHRCPNCSIALTLHGKKNLVCHYCDYAQILNDTCPDCSAPEIKPLGLGTELVEEDIKKLFPHARLARADRDEVSSREDYEHLISQMENHEIDILIGTQMIAKGLDFPKLNLVGLVLADVGFNLPDFRAAERNFQLITQMSGRSGRHAEHGGKVFVQTYNPDYPGLQKALRNDFHGFIKQELEERKALNYPPYGKLASLRFQASEAGKSEDLAELCARRAEELKSQVSQYHEIQILGPAPAPLFKLRNKFRYHLLLKATSPNLLSLFCRQLIGDSRWVPSGTKVQVDIDPINLL